MTLAELRALATIEDGGYHRFPPPYQLMSVTLEEADMLYAIVRATRPRNVLELGTGHGVSARFIAEALVDNGSGDQLITVEPIEDIRLQARLFLADLPVRVFDEYPVGKSEWPDLVYIDSWGEKYRPTDLREWLTNGYTGPIIVHDADRKYSELDLGVGVYLPTANGMWLGRSRKAIEQEA